jgi:hypothetical protein
MMFRDSKAMNDLFAADAGQALSRIGRESKKFPLSRLLGMSFPSYLFLALPLELICH